MQPLCTASFLVVVLLVASASADEAAWSQFRGELGTGVADERSKPPTVFNLKQNLAWSCELPPGHSSPCVRGDRIFVTGYDAASKELRVVSIDRDDGRILWQRARQVPEIEKVHRVSSPATATPVADDERVYAYFGSCGLLCYDMAGNVVWSHDIPVPKTRFGSGSSPILVGERLFLNRDAINESSLLALDRRTGETVWKQQRGAATFEGHATPVLWNDELVIHRSGEVAGHSLEDGKRVWWVSVSTSGCSSPVATKDALYVATWNNAGEPDLRLALPKFANLLQQHDANDDGKLSKAEFPEDLRVTHRPEAGDDHGTEIKLIWFFGRLDFNKDNHVGRFEWSAASTVAKFMLRDHGLLAIKPGGRGNITQSHVAWEERKAIPEVPSPLYYRQQVYMVKNGGIVSCSQADTGKLLFRKRLNAAGPYYASPIAADGRVYFASEAGVVTVLAASREFQLIAQNRFEEPIKASPAVVGRYLYVRTPSRLYAFAEK